MKNNYFVVIIKKRLAGFPVSLFLFVLLLSIQSHLPDGFIRLYDDNGDDDGDYDDDIMQRNGTDNGDDVEDILADIDREDRLRALSSDKGESTAATAQTTKAEESCNKGKTRKTIVKDFSDFKSWKAKKQF